MDCGRDRAICGDPNHTFYVDFQIDYARMEEAAANAGYDAKYEGKWHDGTFQHWSDHRTPVFKFGHRDGLTIFVTSEKPDGEPFWLKTPKPELPDEGSPAVE